MTTGRQTSHVAFALLSAATLYFVLDLSANDRGPIDWAIIGLVSLAVIWNVTRVARRVRGRRSEHG